MATRPPATIGEFDNVGGDDDRREEEAPPDGGYGWICVAACFTINCFTWGTVSAYGIYLSHYLAEDIFLEASTWDYAFIGGFNFSIAMLIAPIVTVLARRFGIHTTMVAGLVFQCGGFTAASFATRIWQLHLTQGVLIGCGIGFLYIPSLPVLSQWFVRRRSLANGISAAGSGVGGAAFAWGTEAIIQHLDIGWALRITGIIAFTANSAAIVVIRDRNREVRPSQLGFDTKLLRRYHVMLLLAWIFISMLGYVTLLFSLSDFALSIGLTRAQATDVIGLLNVGTAVGRPLIGILSDRWSRIDTAAVLTLLCGLSCFAFWLPATSFGLTIFFAIICGAIVGVFWMTIGPLCVEVAGIKDLQSLLSLSWMTVIIPATDNILNLTLPLNPSQHSGISLAIKWERGSMRPRGADLIASIATRIYENWKDTANAPIIEAKIHDRRLPFRNLEFTTQPSYRPGAVLTPLKLGIASCELLRYILGKQFLYGSIRTEIYELIPPPPPPPPPQRKLLVGSLDIINSRPPLRLVKPRMDTGLDSSAMITPQAHTASVVGLPERVERRWLMCWSALFFFALKFHLDQDVRDNLPSRHRLPDQPTTVNIACGLPSERNQKGDVLSMELDAPRRVGGRPLEFGDLVPILLKWIDDVAISVSDWRQVHYLKGEGSLQWGQVSVTLAGL
ncbi:MAG: hypothetical protein Q9212_001196 [Teloschistes hypoglaucus]